MITGKDHTEIKTQKMIELSRRPLCFLDSERLVRKLTDPG